MEKAYCAHWVLPITRMPIHEGAVVIKNDRIVDVLKKAKLKELYPGIRTVDFGRAAIMPGLVNAHTHLETSIFKGMFDDISLVSFLVEMEKRKKRLTAAQKKVSTDMGLMEAISAGITTIGNITDSVECMKQTKDSGLRSVVFYGIEGQGDRQAKDQFERAKDNLAEFCHYENNKTTAGLSPLSIYSVGPHLFELSVEYAKEKDMLVAVHVAGSQEEYQFVKYGSGRLANDYRVLMGWEKSSWQPTGVSPIRYLYDLGLLEARTVAIHSSHIDSKDLDIIEDNDIHVVSCPRYSAKLGGGLAPLSKFIERNIWFGFGTESMAAIGNMDMFDEMLVGLLLERNSAKTIKGLRADLFIKAATYGAAKVLGLDKEVGSLEPGKYADIIAVDMSESHQLASGNPLTAIVYNSNETDVIFTMVNGKILFKNGKFNTIDVQNIKDRARTVRKKIASGV